MVVLQLRAQFPGRPIVLMGWSVGALIASQVSLASAADELRSHDCVNVLV